MGSVESGNRIRDDHIRSAELFDVESLPDRDVPQHPRRLDAAPAAPCTAT